MPKLIYIANTSVDGFTEDAQGNFEFTAPHEGDFEVFATITDLLRPLSTQLYGRRMYETMAVWETDPALAAQSDSYAEFARVWQGSDKVVYSRSLANALTARTRIERTFDIDGVRELKRTAAGDLTIGGPALAAEALRAGLVDECYLFLYPVAVGSGKPALPTDTRLKFELINERRFANDVVQLHYSMA